jgi:threonine dehydratase
VGAFKFRGAYNKLSSLSPERLAAGVCAVSSGNHAQAVALSARLLGAPATIIMPADSPPSKMAATRGYGAEVIEYDRYGGQDRDQLLLELAAERGMERVHPYDDPFVMAGQGTAALELLEQAGSLDTIVSPLGGGGLLSGTATAAEAAGVRVIGVEPQASDDFQRSLAAGERIRIDFPRTIADGQQLDIPGELTFPVIRERVSEVVTVSDEEIVAAMRFLFERMKLVVEPSGATGVAALLAGRVTGAQRVGVIVSGGNVDADRFAALTARS